MIYRIEVSALRLSQEHQQQFIVEAKRAGFTVQADAFTLMVLNLNKAQATTIRDGLKDVGIHSSIGIESSTRTEGPSFLWDMTDEEIAAEVERFKMPPASE